MHAAAGPGVPQGLYRVAGSGWAIPGARRSGRTAGLVRPVPPRIEKRVPLQGRNILNSEVIIHHRRP